MKNPMNDLSFHCTLCSSNENYMEKLSSFLVVGIFFVVENKSDFM